MGYDGSLNFNTEIDEKGFSTGTKKLGTIAKGGLAVVGGLATGTVAAFGAMTKASVDSVANLEQNLGGVETLFKNNANTVIENAKKAYKTAGMSANEYMKNVTSFSASLLQSLGGDTAKAAKVADMAMVDMSDNANKMGTSMESIQNAYQGFAKQNYTMLDNLKLGYGGTKQEMERLLADAEKLTGVKYDINNLSDVYSAIHAVQEELGITGTTALEASETISGSVDMMKAAWDNFLNGTGSPKELADAMVTAGENVLSAVGEIIPRLVETIPVFLSSVVASVQSNLPMIISVGGEILTSLVSGSVALIGQLTQLGFDIISSLISGIIQNAPSFFAKGTEIFTKFRTDMQSRLPEILKTGTEIIINLLNGLLQEAPKIIQQAGKMMAEFIKCLLDALPMILESGAKMILSLLDGLIANGPKIITQIGRTLIDFITEIGSHLPQILQKGVEIIGKLLAGIIQKAPSIIAAIPGIIADMGSAFLNKDWGGIGSNIIDGIKSGIKNAASNLVDAAVSAAKNAVDTVKGWLGIHSPSTRMRDEVGKYMAQGMGVGFEDNIPEDEMIKSLKKSVGNMKQSAAEVTSNIPVSAAVERSTVNNYERNKIDYDKIKKAQLEAMNEANDRPIVLNNRQINRSFREGGMALA